MAGERLCVCQRVRKISQSLLGGLTGIPQSFSTIFTLEMREKLFHNVYTHVEAARSYSWWCSKVRTLDCNDRER